MVSRGGWKRVAFADALKEAFLLSRPSRTVNGQVEAITTVAQLEDWKRSSDEARRALQDYGMYFREIVPSIWVDAAAKTVQGHLSRGYNVIITDIRFPDEEAMVRSLDGMIVHVDREGYGAVNNHVSETNTAELLKRADWTLTNLATGEAMADQLLAHIP